MNELILDDASNCGISLEDEAKETLSLMIRFAPGLNSFGELKG